MRLEIDKLTDSLKGSLTPATQKFAAEVDKFLEMGKLPGGLTEEQVAVGIMQAVKGLPDIPGQQHNSVAAALDGSKEALSAIAKFQREGGETVQTKIRKRLDAIHENEQAQKKIQEETLKVIKAWRAIEVKQIKG